MTENTFSSQARQSAASSAAQKTIAAALSQASQSVRIIELSHFHCFNQQGEFKSDTKEQEETPEIPPLKEK